METARRSILLVEDDDAIRIELGELLRSEGFEVVPTSNGREAMRVLRQASPVPDFIVLDLRLPVMDGWEFRVQQKRDPALASIPVVAISADGSPRAEAVDANCFIKKPFTGEELCGAVNQVLTEVEQERLRVVRAQADRLAALGLLAAGVAHEINNPLAYVMGYLEFIESELGKLEAEVPSERLLTVQEAVHRVRIGSDRIRRIVRDLGVFSRVDQERRQFVDVRDTLELCINLAWNEIRQRGRLIKEFDDVPLVEADEARLGQVFVNLLINAAQALDESKADVNEIRIVTRTDGDGSALIEVFDTGHGIELAHQSRVFDPFFTTKPVGVGTGLGLSISHGIVSSLGGQIELDSEHGKGTVFRVRLPGTTVTSKGRSEVRLRTASGGVRARILVVDDEPMICAMIKRSLEPDHDILTAISAKEALARIGDSDAFDVILCDLMMPEMSGIDFYRELSMIRPQDVKNIVFMTGGAFTPRARQFLDQVDNIRIEKPFEMQAVRAIIQQRVQQVKVAE